MTDVGRTLRQSVTRCVKPPTADLPRPAPALDGTDDDCKYRSALRFKPACGPESATVELQVQATADGAPVRGAAPRVEVLTSSGAIAATSLLNESGDAGVYHLVAPSLGTSGHWTLRFHLFEACAYLDESSPPGELAFDVEVP